MSPPVLPDLETCNQIGITNFCIVGREPGHANVAMNTHTGGIQDA